MDEYNAKPFAAFRCVNNHDATGNTNKYYCARWCFWVLMCEEMIALLALPDMPALPALHTSRSVTFSEGE